MATFVTPAGEVVEARGAMADLFRRRGWQEGEPSAIDPAPVVEPEKSGDDDDEMPDDWLEEG